MTYLLIPGAGGAGWYWHRVEAELRARGHATVAVDLPADDDAAGFGEYADTAVGALAAAADGPITLVAQSLGGFTAPLLLDRLDVARLVFVNAMIPAPGETAGAWWESTGQEQARRELDLREGRPADGFDLTTYFLHDVPHDLWAEGDEHNRRQSDTPFGQVPLHGDWPGVPTEVLIGRDDRFFPADFQVRVAQERLGLAPHVVPGGHLVALSEPAALTEHLLGPRAPG